MAPQNHDHKLAAKIDSVIDKTDCCNPALKVTLVDTATAEYDYESICLSNDGGETVVTGIMTIDNTTNPPVVEQFLSDGSVATGYTQVPCNKDTVDREEIKICKQNSTGKWQVVSFVNVEDTTDIVGPIFINPNGSIVSDPGDLVACEDVTKEVDMLASCDGTTEEVTTTGENPTQVVFRADQVLKVDVEDGCDTSYEVGVRDVCGENIDTIQVTGKLPTEIVMSEKHSIQVIQNKDCRETIEFQSDCEGGTQEEKVDTVVQTIPHAKGIQNVKQCNKQESVSEIEVCDGTKTLIRKTIIDSNGDEVYEFYGDNGAVTTPTTYTIGACSIAPTTTNFISGCSDVDGRIIIAKITTDGATGNDTITFLEKDLTTVVTDNSKFEPCTGEDLEEVNSICMQDALGNKYTVITYTNLVNTTQSYKVWVDNIGDIVPAVSGAVACDTDCESKIEFERCFDTGSGIVHAQGYYKLVGYVETYQTGQVTGSTDPAFSIGDNVISNISSWTLVDCTPEQPQEVDTPLTTQSGTNTSIPAGFKSVTINNITGITTINAGYELGDGRRDNSISFGGDRGNYVNELLPVYTLAGGTWQWIGHN